MIFLYILVFLIWSLIWWLVVRYNAGCLYGAGSYVEALAFSVVTQMTIGYGNTGPQHCWLATWLIIIQSVFGVIIEAVVLGVVFARISHPHQRSRSIFISNKAVIARRDGILKFMFRVADIRTTQVVEPKVKAYVFIRPLVATTHYKHKQPNPFMDSKNSFAYILLLLLLFLL